jgi:methylmalonyl-CoA mutase C-terminal domain/subunit
MSSTFAGMRPAKVLITRIGLDAHDRGSRLVAAYLRDAGMEVVYTGPWQEIPGVVKIALEEDVDLIGISSLGADHVLLPKLMEALREAGLGYIRVVVGGIIPSADEASLLQCGVSAVFHPGSSRDAIVSAIRDLADEARDERA